MKRISAPLLVLCTLALTTTGCMSGKGDGWRFAKNWNVRKAVGLNKDKLPDPQVPTRLVSTWTDTTLHQPGQKPQRGFGGRLLFFKDDSEQPVRVDGQLVVYAYDEAGREDHDTQPTRRYIFPRQQVGLHESESQLGPSYSFWLPWDEVGGEQKNISLIARFEPHGGPLLVGEQTRHLLPGTRMLASGEKKEATKPIGEIQLAQYSQESQVIGAKAVGETAQQRAVPTSIALNAKNWQQRLQRKEAVAGNTTEPVRAATLPGPTPQ